MIESYFVFHEYDFYICDKFLELLRGLFCAKIITYTYSHSVFLFINIYILPIESF